MAGQYLTPHNYHLVLHFWWLHSPPWKLNMSLWAHHAKTFFPLLIPPSNSVMHWIFLYTTKQTYTCKFMKTTPARWLWDFSNLNKWLHSQNTMQWNIIGFMNILVLNTSNSSKLPQRSTWWHLHKRTWENCISTFAKETHGIVIPSGFFGRECRSPPKRWRVLWRASHDSHLPYSNFWYSMDSTLWGISSFLKWRSKVPLFCEE